LSGSHIFDALVFNADVNVFMIRGDAKLLQIRQDGVRIRITGSHIAEMELVVRRKTATPEVGGRRSPHAAVRG
jgi:hypothetical protein